LLLAAQQACKEKVVWARGRVDTVLQVRNQVLLWTKAFFDAVEMDIFRLRWEGPLGITALEGPNIYTLALPRHFTSSPTDKREAP
jgi:hypothetical protein